MWCDACLFSLSDCLLVLFIYRLDENVAGVYEEGEYFEQQEPEHFVEQGKLLRWACIYILLIGLHAIFQSSDNDFEKHFYKGYENYFATLCRNVG